MFRCDHCFEFIRSFWNSDPENENVEESKTKTETSEIDTSKGEEMRAALAGAKPPGPPVDPGPRTWSMSEEQRGPEYHVQARGPKAPTKPRDSGPGTG